MSTKSAALKAAALQIVSKSHNLSAPCSPSLSLFAADSEQAFAEKTGRVEKEKKPAFQMESRLFIFKWPAQQARP
jgi:hypothetical protein